MQKSTYVGKQSYKGQTNAQTYVRVKRKLIRHIFVRHTQTSIIETSSRRSWTRGHAIQLGVRRSKVNGVLGASTYSACRIYKKGEGELQEILCPGHLRDIPNMLL